MGDAELYLKNNEVVVYDHRRQDHRRGLPNVVELAVVDTPPIKARRSRIRTRTPAQTGLVKVRLSSKTASAANRHARAVH